MVSKNRVIFRMEGPEQYNHHLELSVFVEKTKQFLDLLKINANEVGEKGATFHVVSLSHSSPATIECEPMEESTSPAIFNRVTKSLNLVKDEKPCHLSHPEQSVMGNLVQYDPKKIAWMEIHTIEENKDKQIYKLDDHFRKILSEARSAEERVFSTLDGKLEQINIHDNKNIFTIYSSLPHASPVSCKFSNDLLSEVQGALGHFVSIWGECSYRPEAAFPYKIHVQKMEVLPPPEELPSLSDLRGIAPNATGSKSSEQFVRELRDKWNYEES